MDAWHIALGANLVVGIVYFLISGAILGPLSRSKQLRTNTLGLFTGLIFFSCGVGHILHAEHFIIGDEMVFRRAADWHIALWDLTTAGIGLYYWRLRRTYSALMEGAKLFEDFRAREREALLLNDDIVQRLTVVQMALDLGETYKAKEALDATIDSATQFISGLLVNSSGADVSALIRERPGRVD